MRAFEPGRHANLHPEFGSRRHPGQPERVRFERAGVADGALVSS